MCFKMMLSFRRPVRAYADDGKGSVVFQPLAHTFGCSLVLTSLIVGGFCVIMPRFDLRMYLQLVAKHKVILTNMYRQYSKHVG